MGFGFNLGMIFIILPLSLILLFLWIVTKKSIFGKLLAGIWGLIILLSFLFLYLEEIKPSNSRKRLSR